MCEFFLETSMTDTKVKVRTEYFPVVLHTYPVLDLDEEQFFRICQKNKDLRMGTGSGFCERPGKGEVQEPACRLSVNLAPPPWAFSALTSPPWARARSRAMARPRPVPPPEGTLLLAALCASSL